MKNMKEAVELVRKHIKNGSKIFVKIDCDCDGLFSGSALIQFLKELNPSIQIDWLQNYEKRHGLTFKDLENHTKDEYGLIIIPDASMTCKDAVDITRNFSSDILVLDHHIQEEEFFNLETGMWITRDEARLLYKTNRNLLKIDNYTNYCLAVNSTDGQYPNPNLSGAGVVQKFIEAYVDVYGEEDNIDDGLKTEYYDLVSLALNADGMDLRSPETRYYVIEGMKPYAYKNEFINELVARYEEDMKWGRYITSMSWTIAPKINGAVRYGKPEEQVDLFRAILGEQEDREYQPRRKHKDDPKPPIEIQSLQKTMARVCDNIKSRQDSEVRGFVKDLVTQIEEKKLDKNSILFVDGTKVLTTGTVSGLVAAKLTGLYYRPVVLLRSKDSEYFGGSMRNYNEGNVGNLKELLEQADIGVSGHADAAGIILKKDKLQGAIDKCNELLPIESLCTIHQVDWCIPASSLKKEWVMEVAENYAVWGSTVPEPTFAITDLRINASKIMAYGQNDNFIRFTYNGIPFIKKYCAHDDFSEMTLKTRNQIGVNKKDLIINAIVQFQLNSYDNQVLPEVKILYFDSMEDKKDNKKDNKKEDNFDEEETRTVMTKEIEEDEFDW